MTGNYRDGFFPCRLVFNICNNNIYISWKFSLKGAYSSFFVYLFFLKKYAIIKLVFLLFIIFSSLLESRNYFRGSFFGKIAIIMTAIIPKNNPRKNHNALFLFLLFAKLAENIPHMILPNIVTKNNIASIMSPLCIRLIDAFYF